MWGSEDSDPTARGACIRPPWVHPSAMHTEDGLAVPKVARGRPGRVAGAAYLLSPAQEHARTSSFQGLGEHFLRACGQAVSLGLNF